MEEIFHPQSIAVVGASDNPRARGYSFIWHLLEHGFEGKIYPINPKYSEVLCIKVYPSLREVPGSVDYVISCVPASAVPNMLEDCSNKGIKAVHLFTARFSETGRQEDAELEQRILKQAKKGGIRLIGPNCLGIYYPKEGLAFGYDFPKKPGPVGLISQTGGMAGGFIQLASLRGIYFSKVISYGNALDYNESDFLDYLAQDPETTVILMYVEGLKDGKKFFDTLLEAASTKPVIIIKGGRGRSGTRAAASHTASLAGSMKIWETAIAQAGAVSAANFDEMLDLAVSFCFLPPIRGQRVGIAGGSGGVGVLSADQCEEAGLDVIPLPTEMREELKSHGVPIWDWVGNPIDSSILSGFGFSGTSMLQTMSKNQEFDLLIASIYEGTSTRKKDMLSRMRDEVNGCIKVKEESSKPLLVVVGEKNLSSEDHNHWRWKEIREVRTKLLAANIPFYPNVGRAALAARKLIDYYQRRA